MWGLFQTLPAKRKEKDQRFPAKRGYREDLGIEFKSSMEANLYRFYTQLCKWDNIEYEPSLFNFPPKECMGGKVGKGKTDPTNKFNIRGYIPDFRLSIGKFVIYIEAKGYSNEVDSEKIRLMHKHYPWIKIYWVTWDKYKLIENYYKNRIKGWE